MAFDRNPNTGAPFGQGAEVRTATQRVLHDDLHPSQLVLLQVAPNVRAP